MENSKGEGRTACLESGQGGCDLCSGRGSSACKGPQTGKSLAEAQVGKESIRRCAQRPGWSWNTQGSVVFGKEFGFHSKRKELLTHHLAEANQSKAPRLSVSPGHRKLFDFFQIT